MLKITGLNKSFDNNVKRLVVFKDFNLDIPKNQAFAIFGPNGCGKTTLLNIIAGFTKKESGVVEFDGKRLPQSQIGIVLQDYRASLMPWLTAKQNIALPLIIEHVEKNKCYQEVIKICECFHFTANLDAFPYQLSGGQQQFVAILRALITKPKILLMDEPFSSLDFETSITMQELIANILYQTKITALFVSHDIDSSIILADNIALLSNKPARIIKIFDNPLPRPRVITQMSLKIFTDIKRKILEKYYQEIKTTRIVD